MILSLTSRTFLLYNVYAVIRFYFCMVFIRTDISELFYVGFQEYIHRTNKKLISCYTQIIGYN